MNAVHHQGLTLEEWQRFSLPQQILHIGSELSRARSARNAGNGAQERRAYERALELLDFTLSCDHTLAEFRELARLREAICSLMAKSEITISLDTLYKYTLQFSALQ